MFFFQVLNKAARFIVEASKEVKAWSQHRVHMVEHEDEMTGEEHGDV